MRRSTKNSSEIFDKMQSLFYVFIFFTTFSYVYNNHDPIQGIISGVCAATIFWSLGSICKSLMRIKKLLADDNNDSFEEKESVKYPRHQVKIKKTYK